MPTLDEHIGSRLRLCRRVLGLTQTDVGRALHVSSRQIQKYGKGIDRISIARLFKAAQFLDVPIIWFFRGAPPTSGGNGSPPARG